MTPKRDTATVQQCLSMARLAISSVKLDLKRGRAFAAYDNLGVAFWWLRCAEDAWEDKRW
jgi:hypothetical protein